MNSKKAIASIVLLLLVLPGVIVSYFCSFEFINRIDENIYNLYASNGASEINPYNEVFQNADIANSINQIYEESGEQLRTKQEVYRFLLSRKEAVNEVLRQNSKYMDEKNLTIDGFWDFAEKLGELDDNIIYAVIYIWLLVYTLIFYFFFKLRKSLYIAGFLLYMLITANTYSCGLLSWALYHPFTELFALITKETMTAADYSMIIAHLLPDTKEAILTFVLLDTAYQIGVDRRHRGNTFFVRKIFCSLTIIQRALIENQNKDFYITKLRIQFNPVIQIIRRKQKKDRNSKTLCAQIALLQGCELSYKPNDMLPIVSKTIDLMKQNRYLRKYIEY